MTGRTERGRPFDKSKAMRYISDVQDEWAESHTGNLVWKENPSVKSKSAVERLPKSVVLDIIERNVSLIKTLDKSLLPSLQRRIYGILVGEKEPLATLDWLVEEGGVSDERASLILTDQITKARELCKIEEWKRRGVRFAVWRHRGGSKEPRKYHKTKWDGHSGIRTGRPNGLDGFVFDLERPPVIDKRTGERGFPSTLVGCKCYLTGVRQQSGR